VFNVAPRPAAYKELRSVHCTETVSKVLRVGESIVSRDSDLVVIITINCVYYNNLY